MLSTVCHGRGEYARDKDGGGFCEVLIAPKLRARTRPGQGGEVAVAVQVLNCMIRDAKPASVLR